MKEAANTIRQAMRDLNAGRITAEDFRSTMARLRDELGEVTYQQAKWIAVANNG